MEDISCRLDAATLSRQVSSWAELVPLALERRTESGRLSIAFDPLASERLQQLVAVERECCGWAAWNLDGAHLDVTGPPDAIEALASVLLPG